MPVVSRTAFAAAIALFASPLAAHAAAPLEAYGKLPTIEQVALSPDGSQIAVIATNGEARSVVVERLSDHQVSHRLPVGEAKVRRIQWAGLDHLLITTSRTGVLDNVDYSSHKREYLLAFDYNLGTGRLRQLLTDIKNGLTTPPGTPSVRTVNGKTEVFLPGEHADGGDGILAMYRINLETDSSSLAFDGLPHQDGWLINDQGQPAATSSYDDRSHKWTLKVKTPEGAWKESRSIIAEHETPDIVAFGRDGRSILVQEFSDNRYHLHEVAPDGTWGPALDLPEGAEPIVDPKTLKTIGFQALVGDDEQQTFFDPADQKTWNAVAGAFKGQRVHLASWSEDRRVMAVMVDSPTEGPDYAIIDLGTHQASWLGGQYDVLKPEDIGPVKAVRFKAADGMELTGYLTLPHGKETAKNLPLVVFPHGGPAARDEPGFDWWAQAMASRGYAVLQIEYRGSEGFGFEFMKAGFGQWGRKMQTDLSDGVRWLAAQGTIDPKRVCIVGASYGGYAAMAGPTIDPGVYRCAVAYAGVSDLRRMISWSKEQNGRGAQRYWQRFMGADSPDDPKLVEISPAQNAAKANVPILLIHGKDDTVVPLEQSRIMADSLKAAGKPVQFVVFDSTDHWLTKGETRLAMLKATVEFLEKNNPPN